MVPIFNLNTNYQAGLFVRTKNIESLDIMLYISGLSMM